MRSRSRGPVRAAAVLATLATTTGLVAVLTATPAQAATDRVTDTRGDTTAFVSEDSPENPGSTSAARTADIRSARLDHGRYVVLRIVVDDVRRRDDLAAFGLLRSPEGTRYLVRASRSPDGTVEKGLVADGEETPCGGRGLGAAFDLDTDTITLRVARSCLDGPASLRWGATVAAFPADGSVRADDARRQGDAPDGPDGTRLGGNVRFD